ncbi:hypothetical protein ES703_84801 [subsurface metagenome]
MSKNRAERTAGELAVSGNMAKGAGKSLVIIFASSQVTNSSLGGRDPGIKEESLVSSTRLWKRVGERYKGVSQCFTLQS